MAKKETVTFTARLTKNEVKGGAWLASVCTSTDYYGDDRDRGYEEYEAFTNVSAGKRWIKETLIKVTPRKNIKMTPIETRVQTNEAGERSVVPHVDAKGRNLAYIGSVSFKAELFTLDEDDEEDMI